MAANAAAASSPSARRSSIDGSDDAAATWRTGLDPRSADAARRHGRHRQHARSANARRLGQVDEDLEEPGLHRRSTGESVDAAHRSDPRLLDDIFGRRLIPDVGASHTEHRLPLLDDEISDRRGPAPRTLNRLRATCARNRVSELSTTCRTLHSMTDCHHCSSGAAPRPVVSVSALLGLTPRRRARSSIPAGFRKSFDFRSDRDTIDRGGPSARTNRAVDVSG